MTTKDEAKRRPTGRIPRTLPGRAVRRVQPIIELGGGLETVGGPIHFTTKAGEVVGAIILAIREDGVTLRRSDTGTIQFLHRGDYELGRRGQGTDSPVKSSPPSPTEAPD